MLFIACGSFQEHALIIALDGEKYFLAVNIATKGENQPQAGKICEHANVLQNLVYIVGAVAVLGSYIC